MPLFEVLIQRLILPKIHFNFILTYFHIIIHLILFPFINLILMNGFQLIFIFLHYHFQDLPLLSFVINCNLSEIQNCYLTSSPNSHQILLFYVKNYYVILFSFASSMTPAIFSPQSSSKKAAEFIQTQVFKNEACVHIFCDYEIYVSFKK